MTFFSAFIFLFLCWLQYNAVERCASCMNQRFQCGWRVSSITRSIAQYSYSCYVHSEFANHIWNIVSARLHRNDHSNSLLFYVSSFRTQNKHWQLNACSLIEHDCSYFSLLLLLFAVFNAFISGINVKIEILLEMHKTMPTKLIAFGIFVFFLVCVCINDRLFHHCHLFIDIKALLRLIPRNQYNAMNARTVKPNIFFVYFLYRSGFCNRSVPLSVTTQSYQWPPSPILPSISSRTPHLVPETYAPASNNINLISSTSAIAAMPNTTVSTSISNNVSNW